MTTSEVVNSRQQINVRNTLTIQSHSQLLRMHIDLLFIGPQSNYQVILCQVPVSSGVLDKKK